MQAIRRLVQAQFFNLLMLLIASGFAILLAELLWTEHTDGIQFVAVAASVAGLLLILGALFVRGRAATAVAIMLLLLSITGVIGTVEHLESAEEEGREVLHFEAVANQQVAFAEDDDGDERDGSERDGGEASEAGEEGEEGEETPPPLAPLSLAGLSVIGAVAILGTPRKESSSSIV